MARGIPAIVTPEVLQWARDLDRITIDEIAQKLMSMQPRLAHGKTEMNTHP